MKADELNDMVKRIFDSGVDEMKVLAALHEVNETKENHRSLDQKEKNRIKTQIYRGCLIKKEVITNHADTSYTYTNEHDAVLMAMTEFGKVIKGRTKDKMFEFIDWLQSYTDLIYDKEKMESVWKVETETHIFDLMTTRRAYKYWKHNVKGKY